MRFVKSGGFDTNPQTFRKVSMSNEQKKNFTARSVKQRLV